MVSIDYREAWRFAVTGGVATLGNVAAVAATRGTMTYQSSLLCGIVIGITLSYILTKFFAFKARTWSRTGAEAARFLIVYLIGVLIYYAVAFESRAILSHFVQRPALADMIGVLLGAGLMAITGYFGHRFFTYRTNRKGP